MKKKTKRDDKIKKLFFEDNIPTSKLAKRYNVSSSRMYQIIHGHHQLSPYTKSNVLIRDNFGCRLCRKEQIGQIAHHVDRNRCNNDPLNLMTLCRECHVEIHKILREKDKIFSNQLT